MENNSLKKTLAAGLAITALSVGIGNVSLAQKPKQVEVSINDEEIKLETNAKTVKEVLKDIGYEFIEGSKINFSLEDKLINNMDIEIDTEKVIHLNKGGQSIEVKTFASTVKDILKQEGINLGKDDIVTPSLNTELNNGDKVVVDFYKQETYTKDKKIEFATKNVWDSELTKWKSEVQQKGKDGVLTETFTKTIKNGKIISDEKTSEKVTTKPVIEIVAFGSKKVEENKIKHDTKVKETSSMYKGQSKVVQEGKDGLRRKVYDIKNEKKLVSDEVVRKPVTEIIEKGTKKRPVIAQTTKKVSRSSSSERSSSSSKSSNSTRSSSKSSARYSLSDLRFQGIINWGGYKFTYYSQQVLPGGGLSIPGRHINAGGFVADSNGYIVLANSRPKGTVLPTPFGYMGKVYDRGTYGNHIDVYTK